jgi:hypothetical protein
MKKIVIVLSMLVMINCQAAELLSNEELKMIKGNEDCKCVRENSLCSYSAVNPTCFNLVQLMLLLSSGVTTPCEQEIGYTKKRNRTCHKGIEGQVCSLIDPAVPGCVKIVKGFCQLSFSLPPSVTCNFDPIQVDAGTWIFSDGENCN